MEITAADPRYDTRPVGVFDSGAGGISVLREIRRQMPHENLVFFGDDANAPYGTRPQEQIRTLSDNAVRVLLSHRCKAVVIACNTATAAAAEKLRGQYAFPIIGMEPAIKPASAMRKDGIVLSMATPGTLSSDKYRKLYERYGEGVISLPCPGLVEFVEREDLDSPALHACLKGLFRPFEGRKVDVVVLGCTHYVFLRKAVRACFDSGTALIDGNAGTVRQLKRRLTEEGLCAPEDRKGETLILSSGGEEFVRRLTRLFLLPESDA